MSARDFWSYTPREFDALTRWWEAERELYAEMRADLRNVALGKGWKPPSGEAWTGAMLLPGYEPDSESQRDWRGDKAMLKRMATIQTKLTLQERMAHFANVREMQRRSAVARQMTKDGASPEAVRQMMEHGV